jgi:UDP-N-acetylglucosamine diphosphorylase/glucosamine-1-phosphate N-acetyltransferase
MRVCLFEDAGVVQLAPVTLTRPVFDLLCGLSTLGDKQAAWCAPAEVGVWLRPELADLYRTLTPDTPVNDRAWLAAGDVVLVNGRWIPPSGSRPVGVNFAPPSPCVGLVDDTVVYAVVPAQQLADLTPHNLDLRLEQWRDRLPQRPAGGQLVRHLWDLLAHNAEQIAADFRTLGPQEGYRPAQVSVVGPAQHLRIDPTARLDPLVVCDTTGGPVVIDREAVISAFSRLEGPCYIGAGTHVLGAKIRAGTSLGPQCRIGGEVEASIVVGYSNKYHEGFLGHSYVGSWVNFGAGTHTSDLRVDYGPVQVPLHGQPVATGQTKVGSLVGDHVKTGLGVLLNTGTCVGAFAQLLPDGKFLPKYVPPFVRYAHGQLADVPDAEQLWQTAATAMSRRKQEFTPTHRTLYQFLYTQSAGARRQALRQAEQKRLRRAG